MTIETTSENLAKFVAIIVSGLLQEVDIIPVSKSLISMMKESVQKDVETSDALTKSINIYNEILNK